MASCTPKMPVKAFIDRYPNGEILEWSIDKNGYCEAKFLLDGVKYRADFSEEGVWRETERNVKWKDLPQVVIETIEGITSKKKIVELEEVDSQKYGKFYDVEYKKKNGKKQDVMIDYKGKILGYE